VSHTRCPSRSSSSLHSHSSPVQSQSSLSPAPKGMFN
jgi:hypothetical protein